MSIDNYFKNNVNCDIYIGKSAGKKLIDDIDNAKKSVKIISPFTTPFYIEKLRRLQDKGIDTKLITTDIKFNTNKNKNILKNTITQHQHIDKEVLKIKQERIKFNKLLKIGIITCIILIPIFSLFINELIILNLIIIAIIIYIPIIKKNNRIKDANIFSYTYTSNIPLKLLTPYNDLKDEDDYIHSKIFIIDDAIAYLGSVNYTFGGIKTNHETRIRITSPETIQGLCELFNNVNNKESNTDYYLKNLGRKLYIEYHK